ncbi:hypothetical protein ACP4OV_010713 [Aristida adscensionis]
MEDAQAREAAAPGQGGPALPAEVITEILALLPAKSVGRFRAASRAWRAALTSDYFVDLHARRANPPGRPRLLLAAVGSEYDGHLYSWLPGGPVERLMPDDFPDGMVVPLTKPCRGLVLIRCLDNGGYFVCNPSTGEIRSLPDSGTPLKMTLRSSFYRSLEAPYFSEVSYGLGYCVARKEFKHRKVGYAEPDIEGSYHVYLMRDYKEARWEKICYIDQTAWPESERKLLKSLWIAPQGIYYSDRGKKMIMFGTGACVVFAVDSDGGTPQILFTPDETIIGTCEDDDDPVLSVFEESLVSVGRTTEEMISSSPSSKAWSDILKWLPTRSVLELRLVSREWCAMIMTDRFIHSHVVHANLNKSPRIMFIMNPSLGWYMDLENCQEHEPHMIANLVCSQPCYGLNVGSYKSWDFICNPAIGYCQLIVFDDNDETFFARRIGLGYNSKIDKHVVVRITYTEKNLETRRYKLQCKVRYVTAEQWRTLDPPRPIAATPPTSLNGKIYWMVEPNLGPVSVRCEIVAYDVKTHEFEVLQGPPCRHNCGRMTILQLQGALCVACSDQSVNTIDIWMMKDFGTWLMEYHIELEKFFPHYLSENTSPLTVDPKDGRILLNTGWSLGYYDPKTAEIETIYSAGIQENGFKFCPIISHESLFCPLN